MDIREVRFEIVDWIYVGQERDQWRALVNMEMKFRLP